jgi:hypothetical protein
MVGIKAGDLGFYLRTGSAERLRAAGRAAPEDLSAWVDRELWSPVFCTSVVGTVGAGDATVAGFILGLLRAMSPEQSVTAACAAGASSVEAADATSGVLPWERLQDRIEAGWPRAEIDLGPGWTRSPVAGVWLGPRDSGSRSERRVPWSAIQV